MAVFLFAVAFTVIYVFVVSTSVYTENTAKCCDFVFTGKQLNGV